MEAGTDETYIGVRTCGEDAGRPQLRKVRRDGWTEKRREAFLQHLSLTSNVTASAEAAGMSRSSAHALRLRCPEFRAQWNMALEEGYRCLEEQLLARALAGTELPEPPADFDYRRIEQSNKLALTLLANHREQVALIRAHRDGGRDEAAVLDEIKERLAMIRARIGVRR